MGVSNLTREEQLRQRRRQRGNGTTLHADAAPGVGGTWDGRGQPNNATSSAAATSAAANNRTSTSAVSTSKSAQAAVGVDASGDPLIGDPPDEGSIKASDVM